MDWTQVKVIVGACSAASLACISQLLGGWDMWLQVLVVFIILDYLTGVLAALYNKELDSSVGHRGIIKKILILCLVAVAFQLDNLAGTNIIRFAVIGFYVGTEGLSILENAIKAGLNVPDKLKDALVQIKGEDKDG